MKRLPISAAVLLLFAGVWLSLDREGEIRDGEYQQEKTRETQPFAGSASPATSPLTAGGPGQFANPTAKPQSARGVPITPEFVREMVTGPGRVSFSLPDGRTAEGIIEQRHTAEDGSPAGVSGRLEAPGKGEFHFRIQPPGAPTGPVVGAVAIDDSEIAFRVLPGAENTSVLAALPVDQVICRSYAPPPETAALQAIPADHPTDIPYPSYQNGVIPLQSRPAAVAVIYLDFDGQPGPHEGWRDPFDNDFDALPPSGMTPALIKEIWAGVAEDYAPFNLNVTTDLQVYLNAPETSRQRCIITPTDTAKQGAGGVAWVGSFTWSGDTPCWCFVTTNAKFATEVISHEIGHTLGLDHDGQRLPDGDDPDDYDDFEEYYWGHGFGLNSWAPIMGVGYNRNLTQWSKGEYLYANEFEDDVAIIAANQNVGFLIDDAGHDHTGAAILEVFADGSVDSQGNIGIQADIDAFRFTTTGGVVSLAVSPVGIGGNLDVFASLHEADGDLITLANPESNLDATLSASLPAGEYTLRIEGTGQGNPLGAGYTNYGSLGQYKVTGIINGAVGPDRFTILENSPPGSTVGTPLPRKNHGVSALSYQISGGNSNSAFVIDTDTGAITVANPAALDFEALSSGWDLPSVFNLTVAITDTMNPALNESLRVVVKVTNINEAPAITGGTSIYAVSHTVSGVTLGNIVATDPDRFDFATVQIISGDPSGRFSLTPTGLLTLAGELDAAVQATYQLTVRVTDQGAPAITSDETVTVTVIPAATEFTPGLAYQTIYEDIYGNDVDDLTGDTDFPTKPTREVQLSSFSTNARDDTYGSTVRAWLIAPVTGNYRFWISGDDSAQLFLATDAVPANMASICGLPYRTKRFEWTKFGSQQSSTFSLAAGQVCYIEARHKEQFNEDHLAVAWEIKDPAGPSTLVPRQVIPGRYLSPHSLNYSPKMFPISTRLYRNSYPGYQVATPFASDPNPADTLGWAITAGNDSGAFAIDAITGEVTVADAPALAGIATSPVVLNLAVTDNGTNPLSDSSSLTVHLRDAMEMPTDGLIQEFWDGIPGTSLSDLYASPGYPQRPDRVGDLNSFDADHSANSNFGARIRAYFIPPSDSSYTFTIASGTAGGLFLSSDSDPTNAVEIASTENSPTSLPIPLSTGQRYFIETRLVHGTGNCQFTATWSLAEIPTNLIIGDNVTEPYDSNVPPNFESPSYSFDLPENYTTGTLAGTVTATDSPFEAIRYSIISGDPLHAFTIDARTGAILVANPAALEMGSVYQLQVGAQDSGHGRHFAPRETFIGVTVALPNDPPQFTADPIVLGSFPATQPISLSLAPFVTDPEDEVEFALVAGPSWISLTATGTLSGLPGFSDFGSHLLTVSADDGRGHIVQGTVNLVISAPPDVPAAILTTTEADGIEIVGTHDSGNSAGSANSDNLHEILSEALSADTSALEYTWTFPTLPNRPAILQIEAYHSINTESDDFQFSVSTDGGGTFTDAILVTNTSDDDVAQQFSFNAGAGASTIVRVVDTNRTIGSIQPDTLHIDLLTVTLAGNTAPVTTNAIYQVASHAPIGVTIGSAAAMDPDPGQILTYSIPRGNAAGLFSITSTGILKVAGDIAPESGPYSLIVVSTDNVTPALANYSTITVDIVPPVTAAISLENLAPVYDGSPHSAIAVTNPSGLSTSLTYNGVPEAPTNAGTYNVTATIADAIHVGTATGTLVIEKAPAIVTITGLFQAYDGSPKSVSVITSPPSLEHSLSYGDESAPPTDVGEYTVTATITDPNFTGSTIQTFSITNHLIVPSDQTFIVPETTVPYQSLQNGGTLTVSANPLKISGNATNTGILRLFGDAVLDIAGTFTNSGVIDIINWNGTLPPGLINTGTILDRSDVRILTTATSANQFSLSVPGFAGHLYQLETSNLADPWSLIGEPVPGTGDVLNPPELQFTPDRDGPARFYRVVVTPAP